MASSALNAPAVIEADVLGSWLAVKLNRRRLLAYSRLCLIVSLVLWAFWLFAGDGLLDVNGNPVGADFVTFYAASDLAVAGEPGAAYDLERIHQAETHALSSDAGAFAWHYPPAFLLAVSGLSMLPYLIALGVWLGSTGLALFLAVRVWLEDKVVLWLALAFPGVYQNAIGGQTGFLSAAILGAGFLMLDRRPVLGGAVLGLITYKPHFAPLVFLALLAGRQRSAFAGAMASSAGVALLSLLGFGDGTWRAFVDNIPFATDLLYDGELEWGKMTSVTASLLMLGVPELVTLMVQALVSCAAAGIVVWLWRTEGSEPLPSPPRSFDFAQDKFRGGSVNLRNAGLCFAVTLAAPFAFDYDMMILGLGLLFLGIECQRTGWRAWEPELMTLAWLSPVLLVFFALATGIGMVPVLCGALLYVVVRRARQSEVPEGVPARAVATMAA